MNGRKIIAVIVLTALLVAILFEFDISPSSTTEIVDPAIEAEYASCYQELDDEIHATAFGTIDNPDVQKEFITANRARAAAECRALHPQTMIRVDVPSQFSVRLRSW